MPDFLDGWPFWLVFAFMYTGATVRGQALYWAGRLVTEQTLRRTAPTGGWRLRVHRWLSDGGADRGVEAIRRWGLVAVPVSYVTVGFQSLVQMGAGVLRIGWLRYSVAQVPGAAAWATIYSTIGWAVWEAALAAAAGSPASLAGLVAILLVVTATVVTRRRRRPAGPAPALLDPEAVAGGAPPEATRPERRARG